MTDEDITRKMKEFYESGLSLEEVGERFGMTRQGVRHRFVTAGIDRRRPKIIDKHQLEKLYSEERMPIRKIAATLKVAQTRVDQALKFYGIPRRKSLKTGGCRVDFLRSLEIGVKDVITWRNGEEYAHLHDTAKRIGIQIAIKTLGSGEFEVTRLE